MASNDRLHVLFISHEATRTGAPLMLLGLMRELGRDPDLSMATLLVKDGELRPQFEELGHTVALADSPWHEVQLKPRLAARLRLARAARAAHRRWLASRLGARPDLIYANTLATAPGLRAIAAADAPVLVHAHELEMTIRFAIGSGNADEVLRHSSRVVACAGVVRENLLVRHGVPADRVDVIHECIDTSAAAALPLREELARELRASLGLPANARLVGGSGTIEWRKGADVFVQVARRIAATADGAPVYFLWVGGKTDAPGTAQYLHDVRLAGLAEFVRHVPARPDPLRVFGALDVFLLTSREDPFPLVCLEAASCGVPTICFNGGGGMPEFVEHDAGVVVPYLDVGEMIATTRALLEDHARRDRLGACAAAKVAARHDTRATAPRFLAAMREAVRAGARR